MADGGSESSIKTQMPGRVVRILVAEGDKVAEGQAAIVLEAMKMENEMKCPREGTVKRICVSEGQQVESRTVLIELG
jgi:biotin carboxyl carrier protein